MIWVTANEDVMDISLEHDTIDQWKDPEYSIVSRGPGKLVKETDYLNYQLTEGPIEFIDIYKKDSFFI